MKSFLFFNPAKDPIAASEYFKKMDEEVQSLIAKYAEVLKKKGVSILNNYLKGSYLFYLMAYQSSWII